jgi:acyl-CoA thioesterase
VPVHPELPGDAEFLGLRADPLPGRYHLTVENHLARLDGRLYGGTAIAASITAAELVTERHALWMTTQFVSTAPPGEDIVIDVDVLAPGHRTSQVRVTGTNPTGDVMFASLGATGNHRLDGLQGTFENCPEVSTPEESDPFTSPFELMTRALGTEVPMPPVPEGVGFTTVIEFRAPEIHSHPDPGPGRICIWARRRDHVPVTPALAAFVADMVPLSIAAACGVLGRGVSLDNSIRVGAFGETEWVLVDLRPHLAVGDYGHGVAHLWSERGHLLGTASQSATMTRLDLDDLPWDRR